MQAPMGIRRAYTPADDARKAAQELYRDVVQPEMELVLFFCSSDYDLEVLAGELNALFPRVRLIGCTSAGEIGPGGYLERGIAGVSFSPLFARQPAARSIGSVSLRSPKATRSANVSCRNSKRRMTHSPNRIPSPCC
jgi:hypothetical protein